MANISTLPACGLLCAAKYIANSTCLPTNATCYCHDQTYSALVSACVSKSCSIRDSLTLANATATTCGIPSDSIPGSLQILWLTLYVLLTAFFVVRVLSRLLRLAKWGIDDTTMVAAWFFTTCFFAAGPIETALGAGKSSYALQFWQITALFGVFFAFEIVYTLALGTIKLAIVFLYIRLFPERKIQRLLWATQIAIIVQSLVFIVGGVAQCQPISYVWTKWDGEHEGKCINVAALTYAQAAINIALDLWMLWIPASQVWKLNMTWKRKFGVLAMFLVGIFLTVASCLRLATLVEANTSLDNNAVLWQSGIWSAVELATGVCVACVPAARTLFVKYATSIKQITTKNSSNNSTARSGSAPASSQKQNGQKGNTSGSYAFSDKHGGKGSYSVTTTSTINESKTSKFGGRINKIFLPMPQLAGSKLMTSIGQELDHNPHVQRDSAFLARTTISGGSKNKITTRDISKPMPLVGGTESQVELVRMDSPDSAPDSARMNGSDGRDKNIWINRSVAVDVQARDTSRSRSGSESLDRRRDVERGDGAPF